MAEGRLAGKSALVTGANKGIGKAIARFGGKAKAAVNETWARETDAVKRGDTVALLPPVAGG